VVVAELTPLGRTFRRRGWIGFGLAAVSSIGLAAASGLSALAQAGIVLAAVGTFLGLAMATKIVLGREALIYYHHEIAVLTVTAGVAAAFGQPVLAHLDVTAAGLGAFLCLGRTGCLAVGCCHGRPARRGVRYGPAHVAAGFPAFLEGVTLFPVQAAEAGGAALLSAAAGVLALTAAPGTGFAVYVTGYALARFGLERLRGDAPRPVWRGLSEAQWTSLAVVAGLAAAGRGWHLVVLVVLLVAAPVAGRRVGRHPLDPEHVRSVARALDAPTTRVRRTSQGIRVSSGRAGEHTHYALSHEHRELAAADAGHVARLVVGLRHPGADAVVVRGVAGVWHVLVAGPAA
jgi:hypothetical protein